jgi:hypothetical protein
MAHFTRLITLLVIAVIAYRASGFAPSSSSSSSLNRCVMRPVSHAHSLKPVQIIYRKDGHAESKYHSRTTTSLRASIFQIANNPKLTIGAGSLGFFILLVNRLLLPLEAVPDTQSRADIISVLACSALLLNVFSEQEFDTRERDAVALFGYSLEQPMLDSSIPKENKDSILWAIKTLLGQTPSTSVHVFSGSNVLGRGGVIGYTDQRAPSIDISSMGILKKSMNNKEEVYLPDLQILPGKVEFSYLPLNAQSVLIVPFTTLSKAGAVVVTTNQAKVLKVNDLNRIRSVVEMLDRSLSSSSTSNSNSSSAISSA